MYGSKIRARGIYYILIALFFALLFWAHSAIAPTLSSARSDVTIDGTTIAVLVAQTPQEQEKGLSGRPSLPWGEGMLFVFDRPDRYGFWMPDMNFAIDIVWIGNDWHIVDISENVTPESYPKLFSPNVPAQYVLEVSAGSAKRYGWKAGDVVKW